MKKQIKNKIILLLLCTFVAPQCSLNAMQPESYTAYTASSWSPWYLLGAIGASVGGYFGYKWYKNYNSKHNKFLRAAKNGDLAAVRVGLQDQEIRENINQGNSYQQTALALASASGNESTVEALLDAGANANLASVNGVTPLHSGVRSSSQSIISKLIGRNVNVNAQTRGGSTALHYAARGGKQAITEQLIAANADVKKQNNNGNTALHVAAWNGSQGVVEKLVDSVPEAAAKAAFVNIPANDGSTALHYSSQRGHEVIGGVLIKAGADATRRNNRDQTPQQSRDAVVSQKSYNQGSSDTFWTNVVVNVAAQELAAQYRERDRRERRNR